MLLFLVSLALPVFPAAAGSPLDGLVDVRSSQWRTSQPIVSRLKTHTGRPDKLTIHYTGMKKNSKRTIVQKLQGLFNFSTTVIEEPMKKKLWGDVPYHFYVDMNGTVAEARDMKWQPDTNTFYRPNGTPDRHITIVVEAGSGDTLSDDQKGKLFALMRALQRMWKIDIKDVRVHSDYADTSCPGPSVAQAVREYVGTSKPSGRAKGKAQ